VGVALSVKLAASSSNVYFDS